MAAALAAQICIHHDVSLTAARRRHVVSLNSGHVETASRRAKARRCLGSCTGRASSSWSYKPRARPVAAAASSSTAGGQAATEAAPAAVLVSAAKTQLLRCELGGSGGSGSGTLWLEVVRVRQGRVEALCSGELLQLSVSAEGQLSASASGFFPRLGDAWVKATPGLVDSLKKVRAQQAADGSLPSQLIAAHGIAALQPLQTLAQFQAEVAAAPAPWCAGTAPGDSPLSQQQQALLTAGELAAFLAGHRGVALLQLHKGWGDQGSAMQPLLRPWVLSLLQQAAEHRGAALLASAAAGQLGTSLVVCSRQQPWLAWGRHLASQGVQSAIVADSPFYKLLIGRILGYQPANIYHHIESTGGRVSEEVVAAVDAELAALSSVPPTLPWASAGRWR